MVLHSVPSTGALLTNWGLLRLLFLRINLASDEYYTIVWNNLGKLKKDHYLVIRKEN